jgi:hypothetical protein
LKKSLPFSLQHNNTIIVLVIISPFLSSSYKKHSDLDPIFDDAEENEFGGGDPDEYFLAQVLQ